MSFLNKLNRTRKIFIISVLLSWSFVWYLWTILNKNEGPLPPHVQPRPQELTTPANQWLLRFPFTIPGARKIEKYAYPNATKCLVHIRQEHELSDMTPEEIASTSIVQDDIYTILSFLIPHYGISEVFTEGVAPEYERLINSEERRMGKEFRLAYIRARTAIQLRRLYVLIAASRSNNKTDPQYRSGVERLRVSVENDSAKFKTLVAEIETPYRLKAMERLLRDGRITLRATEDILLNTELVNWVYPRRKVGLSRWEFWGAWKMLMNSRERDEKTIAMIAKAQTPVAIMVFGGGHEFRRILIDRNNEPGIGRMSLIEITPQRYSHD